MHFHYLAAVAYPALAMKTQHWRPGDTVILRYPPEDRMARAYLARTGDVVANAMGWPHLVLRDGEELVALYMPEGALLRRWNVEQGQFRPARVSQGESVRLLFPDKRYEVTMFYNTGTGPAPWVKALFPGPKGRFYGWKVDLTSPFYRTPAGFDVIDEVLDLVVNPDRSFRWKDEDELRQLTASGVYTDQEALRLRQVAHEVIELIEAARPPFDDEWQEWRPPAGWRLGAEREGWQFLPVQAPYRPYLRRT